MRATTDRTEALNLDIASAVLTPAPATVLKDLDDDVVARREPGKNSVAGAVYSVSIPNGLALFRRSPARILIDDPGRTTATTTA